MCLLDKRFEPPLPISSENDEEFSHQFLTAPQWTLLCILILISLGTCALLHGWHPYLPCDSAWIRKELTRVGQATHYNTQAYMTISQAVASLSLTVSILHIYKVNSLYRTATHGVSEENHRELSYLQPSIKSLRQITNCN